MANEAVLKYLQDTNRPYSCTDVTANLRGAYNKGAVQRALDALSEAGAIRCKPYGKQKVYVAVQNYEQTDGENVGELEEKLKALKLRHEEITSALKAAEMKLKALLSRPTDDEAKLRVAHLREANGKARSKLDLLKSSTGLVSEEEKQKITTQHQSLYKEYRKRKSICTQMLDAILEGYPKSKKSLIEELCLETDEMVDFKPTAP